MKDNIIMALDTASKKTGYAIYRNSKITKHGVWKINENAPYSDLECKITSTIARYKATILIAEDIYKSNNPQYNSAWRVLCECHGVIHLICEREPIKLHLLDARRAKREMWGYTIARKDHREMSRVEQKQRMIRAVTQLGYQLQTDRNGNRSDDNADAIGLLITYCKLHHIPITHPLAK